jgi:hypothetical protein
VRHRGPWEFLSGCGRRDHGLPAVAGGYSQLVVPGDDQQFRIIDQQSACEVHGVIAAQRVTFGEATGLLSEGVIDSEQPHRGDGVLEIAHRAAQATLIYPSLALRGR